jgi:hypothetical protein
MKQQNSFSSERFQFNDNNLILLEIRERKKERKGERERQRERQRDREKDFNDSKLFFYSKGY